MRRIDGQEVMRWAIALMITGWVVCATHAQVISRNDQGDIIVSYTDGSWRYFMSSDSTMLSDAYQHFLDRESAARSVQISSTPEVDVNLSEEDAMTLKRLQVRKRRIDEGLIEVGPKEYQSMLDEIAELTNTSKPASAPKSKRTKSPKPEKKVVKAPQREVEETEVEPLEEDKEEAVAEETIPPPPPSVSEIKVVKEAAFETYDRSEHSFNAQDGQNWQQITPCILDTMSLLTSEDRTILRRDTIVRVDDVLYGQDVPRLQIAAALSDVYGSIFIEWTLDIEPEDRWPQDAILEQGDIIRIGLVDGERIELEQTRASLASRVPFDTQMTYQVKCLLSREDRRMLSTMAIDYIEVKSDAGWLKYEVFDVYLLRNQLACLEKL